MDTNSSQPTNDSVQKEIDELEALEEQLQAFAKESEQLEKDIDAFTAQLPNAE